MAKEHEFQQQETGAPLPDNLVEGRPFFRSRAPTEGAGIGSIASGGSVSQIEALRMLLRGLWRQADFTPFYGSVSTVAVLIRPRELRGYLIIQNTSVASRLSIGIGYAPTIATGILLLPGGGAYEPWAVPQGDIWMIADASCTFVGYFAPG
jgi:hypothetical protein